MFYNCISLIEDQTNPNHKTFTYGNPYECKDPQHVIFHHLDQ